MSTPSFGPLLWRLSSIPRTSILWQSCSAKSAFRAASCPLRRQVSVAIATSQRKAFHVASACFREERKRWTTEEDEKLCQLRLSGASKADIATQLDERTVRAVDNRLHILKRQNPGLRNRLHAASRYFTEMEDQLILEMKTAGRRWVDIGEALPGRSINTLKMRYSEISKGESASHVRSYTPLFSKPKKWTPREDDLIKLRITLGLQWQDISAKLARSLMAVKARGTLLGCPPGQKSFPYTPQEDVIVLAKSGGVTWKEISVQLPHRTLPAIQSRWTYLTKVRKGFFGRLVRKWTPKEDDLLLKMKAAGESAEKIGMALPDRSMQACDQRYYVVRARNKLKTWKPQVDEVPMNLETPVHDAYL